jgi:GcrA cell cycle regulator
VTRNAVIGKVHRLGLSGRAAPSQPARPAFKAPRPARPLATQAPRRMDAQPQAAAVAPQPPVVYLEEPGSATVLTLGAHMCKWPIGDPSTDGFSFCGRRTGQDGPYCIEHARLAYQPQQARKRSTASDLARSLRRYI